MTSHNQLADKFQRLGSRFDSTFVDGVIHSCFGTHNFTTSIKYGKYIEVVCPLDYPAPEQTPRDKAVLKKAIEVGGRFTWVGSRMESANVTYINKCGKILT